MKAKSVPVAILVRVSTLKQETDRQVSELLAHAKSKGYEVVEICREQISGMADESDRHGLHRAEELARTGAVRKILVHEVSRLARRNSVAHAFVETLEELGVSLYWHQQGIETLLPNGKRNPAAAIMFALLAEMARAERETLSERIKSGLDEARRKGRKLGRPTGTASHRKGVSCEARRHSPPPQRRPVRSEHRQDHRQRDLHRPTGEESPRRQSCI